LKLKAEYIGAVILVLKCGYLILHATIYLIRSEL